jgi:hypothetical protein
VRQKSSYLTHLRSVTVVEDGGGIFKEYDEEADEEADDSKIVPSMVDEESLKSQEWYV